MNGFCEQIFANRFLNRFGVGCEPIHGWAIPNRTANQFAKPILRTTQPKVEVGVGIGIGVRVNLVRVVVEVEGLVWGWGWDWGWIWSWGCIFLEN